MVLSAQAEIRTNMSLLGPPKIDFLGLACDSELTATANRRDAAVEAEGVQKGGTRYFGHKGPLFLPSSIREHFVDIFLDAK